MGIIGYYLHELFGTKGSDFGWWNRRFQLFGSANGSIIAINGQIFPILHNLPNLVR